MATAAHFTASFLFCHLLLHTIYDGVRLLFFVFCGVLELSLQFARNGGLQVVEGNRHLNASVVLSIWPLVTQVLGSSIRSNAEHTLHAPRGKAVYPQLSLAVGRCGNFIVRRKEVLNCVACSKQRPFMPFVTASTHPNCFQLFPLVFPFSLFDDSKLLTKPIYC